jgi:hypothetical protein
MPYTIYKTNGIKLTTVEDGTLNLTTDLQLVGKNYAGYGQVVNGDLVKLLENFANASAPSRPLAGQLWYDTTNEKIKFYTGTRWTPLATTNVSSNIPTDLSNGEFWYDASSKKLYIKYNGNFELIGPGTGGLGSTTSGSLTTTRVQATSGRFDVIELPIGEGIPAIVSSHAFTVDPADPLISLYTTVKNGITLYGADPVTGISSSTGVYFWGTAADSARLGGKRSTDYLAKTEVGTLTGNIATLTNITFISSGSPATPGRIEGTWQLTAGSTLQATYADIAERYHADDVYEPGTVLVIGGEFEVTISTNRCDPSIAGIVSTNPAYKLNSDAGTDKTHPYIALKGRVPCKVIGNIKKGDLLITSAMPGVACAMTNPDLSDPNAIIGKALQDYSSGLPGIIEVKV